MSYTISRSRMPSTPRETIDPNFYLVKGWKNDWSDWTAIMSPTQMNDDWEKRSGDNGYKLKSRLVSKIFISESGRTCGIYEFIAVKGTTKQFVVYVGCSCRSIGKSLPERINEYCADGSHKAELIDDALKKGYTLGFRYRVTKSKKEAENDENRLLVKYSYPWNRRMITGTLPN